MNAAILAGRHAVVTGGGGGIGAAIAGALDRLGARITLMGRSASPLRAHAGRLGEAQAVTVDITQAEQVTSAFAEASAAFGPVQILVNNAGAANSAPFGRLELAAWQSMLDVNLTGTFLCIKAALSDMQAAGWGRVVNIASTAGLTGYRYVAAYCAAKHGVVGLTRALALETAAENITVNAVCPGYTQTDLLDDVVQNIARKTGLSQEKAAASLVAVNPQGRFVQPEEVAAVVTWLCSPGAESITGQAIAVAGGEVM